MHWLNWAIVLAYLAYVLIDGVRRSKGTTELEGYFLASRSLPWWAVGLSVMATQLSAVTMIGTTGQGASDGMRFLQFYFGLPLAMVILGVTLVPFLHRAKVFTAYEFLERRFSPTTRSLTALLFLISRGMSCGVIVAAPAVVFSAVLGWSIPVSVALIGIPTVIYTVIGGVQAVTWVDVKQMVLIVVGLVAIAVALVVQIPVGPVDALHIAGAAGRLKVFDTTFSLSNQYTLWSGLIGGTFLMMSYFGTDQSQAQRYLTAKSVDEARSSLLMSAYWKIPLQALVLLIGVLIFVFYQFSTPPMLYNPEQARETQASAPAEYGALQQRYDTAVAARREAALAVRTAGADAVARFRVENARVDSVRTSALALVMSSTGRSAKDVRDVNYIMPRFVLNHLPLGFAGLFIAAVMAAAMSSIAAELNSLATSTVIDFYRRWFKPVASDAHFLNVSKAATALWGMFACAVAVYSANLGSLIEVVNRFGSFFYGSILGVFLLAMVRRANAKGAIVGLAVGMATVGFVNYRYPTVAFLWHNVIGAVVVVAIGTLVSVLWSSGPDSRVAATDAA
jgi:SSS family solute:Na+ symporter